MSQDLAAAVARLTDALASDRPKHWMDADDVRTLLDGLAETQRERDQALAAVGDQVAASTLLTGMAVRNGGVDVGFQGGAAQLMAELFAQEFKDGQGINYIEMRFTSQHAMPGESFLVTVQRLAGKTAHDLRLQAEAERDTLRARVAELEARCPQ